MVTKFQVKSVIYQSYKLLKDGKVKQVYILIPVFNEGEVIKETVEKILKSVKSDYELIICYDFEEDKTIQIIKENFKDSRILFVKNLKSGFNSAIIT